MLLLYSWRFSRYSAPFHWLVHGHMTSNNETVSRQMLWAGNIAKTMTSNGKQFTGTREMLTAVARDGWNLSAVFKLCFCFVLLYNKIHSSPLPSDQSLSVNCCSKYDREHHIFRERPRSQLCSCESLLTKVITGAVNFDWTSDKYLLCHLYDQIYLWHENCHIPYCWFSVSRHSK